MVDTSFLSDADLGGNNYDGANQLTTARGHSNGTCVLPDVYPHSTSRNHAGRQTYESGARAKVLAVRLAAGCRLCHETGEGGIKITEYPAQQSGRSCSIVGASDEKENPASCGTYHS